MDRTVESIFRDAAVASAWNEDTQISLLLRLIESENISCDAMQRFVDGIAAWERQAGTGEE